MDKQIRVTKGFKIIVCAVTLCFGALPARAWGPLGHKIVAIIAQKRLSPRAARSVRQILGSGVGLDQIANCPDTIKYATAPIVCASSFAMAPKDFKASYPWHFIDIPLNTHPAAADLKRYCPHGQDCVTEQIRRQANVLGDSKSSQSQKQVALMFLVHFVGDLHQPLHCEDNNDWGGNKEQVIFMGVHKRLHELWDDLILPENWQVQATEPPGPWVSALESDLSSRRKAAASWISGDWINRAALESHAIARDVIYPRYAQDHGKNWGRPYQRKMQPIVRERLEMAGVRLAALLNQVLGGG